MFLAADPFNEMQPASSDLEYLAAANRYIYEGMSAVYPTSVYVMQGWLFLNDHKFWKPPRVEAFLSGVPNSSMLILDLASDERVVAAEFNSYFGKPWVYNQLQVFGGRRGLYGSLDDTSHGAVHYANPANSTMVGIGATPEALEINPVTWDLLWEMGWRHDSPELDSWVSRYAVRRYGCKGTSPLIQQAWEVLRATQYTEPVGNYATSQLCWLEQEPALKYSTASDRVGELQRVAACMRAAESV